MSNATSGTLRSISFDGMSFDVTAEINVTLNRSPYETEGQATSGRTMYKSVMRIQTAEGITISATPDENEMLTDLAIRTKPFKISATLANGQTYMTTGRINAENYETESNQATVSVIPARIGKDAWKLFG